MYYYDRIDHEYWKGGREGVRGEEGEREREGERESMYGWSYPRWLHFSTYHPRTIPEYTCTFNSWLNIKICITEKRALNFCDKKWWKYLLLIFTKMGIWKWWCLRRGWWAERLPALTLTVVRWSAAVAHCYQTNQSLLGWVPFPQLTVFLQSRARSKYSMIIIISHD